MKRPNMPVQGQGFVQPETSHSDILNRHKSESRIDSRLFAERIGIKHKSLYSLIQKHKAGLRELGILPFQTERLKTNQHGEREHKFALVNVNQSDYIRHIASNCAAACMKHVKPYQGEDLPQYRAGGPVWCEYFQDTGMTHKTKATVEGSPVEIKIKEIKRIANYATAGAGEQYAVYEERPRGPDGRIFLQHVLFRKSSSAKASGASLCSRARALSSLRVNSVALACSRAAFRLSSCSVMRALACVTIVAKEFFSGHP